MEFPTPIVVTLLGLVCAALGWFVRELWDAHKAIRVELYKFKEEVPREYVRREDYREDMREVKEMLQRIWDALDGKQGKA